jgi:hypothetical protein
MNAFPAEFFRLTFTQLTPPPGGHRLLQPILVLTILQDFAILLLSARTFAPSDDHDQRRK